MQCSNVEGQVKHVSILFRSLCILEYCNWMILDNEQDVVKLIVTLKLHGVWKNINAREYAFRFVKYSVGVSSSFPFWHDHWLNGILLVHPFNYRFISICESSSMEPASTFMNNYSRSSPLQIMLGYLIEKSSCGISDFSAWSNHMEWLYSSVLLSRSLCPLRGTLWGAQIPLLGFMPWDIHLPIPSVFFFYGWSRRIGHEESYGEIWIWCWFRLYSLQFFFFVTHCICSNIKVVPHFLSDT